MDKAPVGRVIALQPRTLEALGRMRAKYRDLHGPFYWAYGRGNTRKAARRTHEGIWDDLRGVLPWLDADCVIHTFRHTFASRIIRAGGTLDQLQVLLGHTDPKTTQRYRKYAVDNSREVARLLAARREYEMMAEAA